MQKILYTSKCQGHPPIGGPKLRTENSIKALNLVSELHLVSQVRKIDLGSEDAEDFYRGISKNFVYAPSVRTIKNFKEKIQRKINQLLIRDADFIVDYAKKNDISIIWVGFGSISYSLLKRIKKLQPKLQIICDTDSIWSRFILRELSCQDDPKKRKKILQRGQKVECEEAEWIEFCDCITAVSKVDAEYYRSLTKNFEKVFVFSNVIDIESYKNNFDLKVDVKNPSLFLAGSFWKDSPMEFASRWVIDEILPIVQDKYPDIIMYIAGFGSNEVLSDINKSNVKILGTVESVLPYLFNVNMALVPLKFESGTRYKILEAAACKTPIVSTTLGAEGIPVTTNENILLADDTKSFAEAIITLLDEPQIGKKISDNCYEIIKNSYSVESLAVEANEIINFLNKA